MMMSRLYAALKTLRFVSRVSEGVDSVRDGGCPVRVCCVYGLGFGSDVTIVVRLDGSSE
jgi:hypothetical protein